MFERSFFETQFAASQSNRFFKEPHLLANTQSNPLFSFTREFLIFSLLIHKTVTFWTHSTRYVQSNANGIRVQREVSRMGANS